MFTSIAQNEFLCHLSTDTFICSPQFVQCTYVRRHSEKVKKRNSLHAKSHAIKINY